MLAALIGPISNLAGTWLEGKVEKTKAETGAKVAKAKAEAVIMEKKATGEIDWDLKMADASASSWKDEWFTLLLSAPVVALMWGISMNDVEILDRIGIAFGELNMLPDWYQYLLFMAVSASFGIRGADKLLALKGKKD